MHLLYNNDRNWKKSFYGHPQVGNDADNDWMIFCLSSDMKTWDQQPAGLPWSSEH